MHHARVGEKELRGVKGEGHARDREQRTQCIFIRIWQVNTRWQQCCHAVQGHSEALMCSVAGRLWGPVVGYSDQRWHTYVTSQNILPYSIKAKYTSNIYNQIHLFHS